VHVRGLVDLLELEKHRVENAELLTHCLGNVRRRGPDGIGDFPEPRRCFPAYERPAHGAGRSEGRMVASAAYGWPIVSMPVTLKLEST
jgi:hypothetical protein